MKIAVFADTHGNGRDLADALRARGDYDALIHLGDGAREGEDAARAAGIEFIGVRGNEDFASVLPRSRVVDLCGVPLLLMHGDALDLNPYHSAEKWEQAYRGLSLAARMEGACAVLYGHTHRAEMRVSDGILLCNPGDMYIGSPSPPSFVDLFIGSGRMAVRLMELSNGSWIGSGSLDMAVPFAGEPGSRTLP